MALLPAWAEQAAVGRLATIDCAGLAPRPHVVPVVFCALDDAVYVPIDGKPKTGRPLKRVANIEANPAVSLLIDHYERDWARLRWLRIDGHAAIVPTDPRLAAALASKYPQYASTSVGKAAIRIAVQRSRAWAADASAAR